MTGAAAARPRWRRLPSETLLPLAAAYLAFAAFYAWQAWRREVPTIFTDELELTQIARSIADTGTPGRRGEPLGFTSLYPWFVAPAWWLDGTVQAFGAVKLLGTLAMTAAVFPAYALARTVVSRPYALFAAVATIAAPALSYSAIVVEEPLAFPLSTLALWLTVRAAARPAPGTVALAAAACLLATLARSQLAVLLVVLAAALAVVGWRSGWARRRRASWTAWDRVGALVLGVGAALALSALLAHRSGEWYVTSTFYKDRLWDYGTWAAGALTIGVGVFPLVACLAALPRPRGEPPHRGREAFSIVAASALLALGWYASVKGAYLSTTFSSLVVERNLIYLGPLLFAGTALLLERRRARAWSALAGGGAALYLVWTTPYRLDQYPYYEAHGLAILAFANRLWHWPAERIEHTLIAIALASTAVVLLLRLLPRGRAAGAAVAALAALVLVWNLTAEIYAANGERRFAERIAANAARPLDWVDRATKGGTTVLVTKKVPDPTGIWITEFFNRSIGKVWGVDPSSPAPGPGPILTPDLAAPDGTLSPAPGTAYALAVDLELQAPVVRTLGASGLYRLDGGPLRLRATQTGVDSDGWMGEFASYTRFDGAERGRGFVKVELSRTGWCGANVPGHVRVTVGPAGIGADRQPATERVTAERRLVINACEGAPVVLPVPPGPWRAEVSISPTFVPAELDPRSSERRSLGAQVAFSFIPLS